VVAANRAAAANQAAKEAREAAEAGAGLGTRTEETGHAEGVGSDSAFSDGLWETLLIGAGIVSASYGMLTLVRASAALARAGQRGGAR